MQIKLKPLVLASVILTFIVIVLGAYTRLKDAGLGCPDWPGCYGKLLAPKADNKAWIEMIHRYVAGTLGILILIITIRTNFCMLACALLALVIFQALLGMWTVTLGLYPMVVMGHLLGGFAILALSWLLYLSLSPKTKVILVKTQLKILGYLSLIVLILQIALGAWTSANYAALVCADFPSCQGQLWPAMDWYTAFNLSASGIFNSPGVPLENTARVTIQMAHRLGALITTLLLCAFSFYLKPRRVLLVVLLIVQLSLGIANVLARLPLAISLMHSAVAALLLLCCITILTEIYVKPLCAK